VAGAKYAKPISDYIIAAGLSQTLISAYKSFPAQTFDLMLTRAVNTIRLQAAETM
jgi:hypothetical protein